MKFNNFWRYTLWWHLIFALSACGTNSDSTSPRIQNKSTLMGGAIQGNSLQLSQAVSTFAGVSPGSSDGIGSSARFNSPYGITTDGTSIFVADRLNRTIRKIDIATHAVTTIAGSVDNAGNVDGVGIAAGFSNPGALCSDGTNLYVVDGSTIRKLVIATGAVTTLAGDSAAQGSSDGTGVAAKFNNPSGIATDGINLFIADAGNFSIRKIVIATADVTTLAGTAGSPGVADGIGSLARFGFLGGLATDGLNLFVADSSNNTIRKIVINTGEVSTLAGFAGHYGSTDGTGLSARFGNPTGVIAAGTTLYISETVNGTIRKLDLATGSVTTLAGSARTVGAADGVGASASFYGPSQLTIAGTSLFVTDAGNCTIRKVSIATAAVATFAGIASPGADDGTGATAKFRYPNDLTTDGFNLFVTDTFNHTIRKIVIATGEVSTFAGSAGKYGTADGIGTAAKFFFPKGITTDGTNLFVTDNGNYTIRKVVITTGEVSTLAGSIGISASSDGIGTAASFKSPYGITTDGANLYVTDAGNHTIRKIVIATGDVTTLAGTAGTSGKIDGIGTAAKFYSPSGITTDGQSIFVADLGNSVIRKIKIATAEVTTLIEHAESAKFAAAKVVNISVGNTSSPNTSGVGTTDPAPPDTGSSGTGASSSPPVSAVGITATSPISLTTDGINLYITNLRMIRKMEIATGNITTIAGGVDSGSRDGIGTEAIFSSLNGITSDGKSLYVTDNSNNTVRKID